MTAKEYHAYLASQGQPIPAATANGKPPSKPRPANQLTKAVLTLLRLRGFHAWRQNNAAVYDASFNGYRAGSATPGISDILGYHKPTGRFCAVEIKAGKDTLSPEQTAFLAGITAAGGFACCARDVAQLEAELTAYLATLA